MGMAPTAGGPRSSGALPLLSCPVVGLAEPTRVAGRTPCHSVMHDMPKVVRCPGLYSCLGWHIPSNPDGRNDRRLDCIITLSAQASLPTMHCEWECGPDREVGTDHLLLGVAGVLRESAEWERLDRETAAVIGRTCLTWVGMF